MSSPESEREQRTRRRVLRLAGSIGVGTVVAGCAGPGDDDEPDAEEETGNGQDPNGDDESGEDDEEGAAEADAEDDIGDDGETDEDENGDETGAEDDADGATMDEPQEDDVEDWEGVDSIVLEGTADQWTGVEPEPIEGVENPTLILFEGDQYSVQFENADGDPHSLGVLSEEGDVLEETDLIEEEGDTERLEFDATDEMVEYFCDVHPGTMRGGVHVETDS